jgi:hypothetical protein
MHYSIDSQDLFNTMDQKLGQQLMNIADPTKITEGAKISEKRK